MSSPPTAAAGRKGQGGAADDDGRSPAPDVGPNWSLLTVSRKGGKTAGHKDSYWFSPGGKRFRSKAEIGRFKDALETLEGGDDEGDEDAAWKIMKNKSSSSSSKKKTPSAKKKKKATSTPTPKKAARKSTSSDPPLVASTPGSRPTTSSSKSSKKISSEKADTATNASATKKQKQKQKQITINCSKMVLNSDDDDGEEKKEDDDMGAAGTSMRAATTKVKKSKSSSTAAKGKSAKATAKKSKAATTAAAASKKGAAKAKDADYDDGGVSGEDMDDFDAADSDFEEKPAVAAKAQKKRKKDVAVTSTGTSSDEEGEANGSSEEGEGLKTPMANKKGAKRSTSRKPAKKKSKVDEEEEAEEEEEDTTPTPPPTTASRSGRVRKAVVRDNMVAEFHSDISSSEDEDDDFERRPAARKGRGAATNKSSSAGRGKKRVPPADDDSSEQSEVSSIASESSEEFSDDFEDEESEDEMDFEEEEEQGELPKKKRGRGGNSGGAKKAKIEKATDSGKQTKSMAESFKPMNAPPYYNQSLEEIHRDHECLDPCGTEATDDIIDRLVGDQVDKIGALLCRALKSGECDLGNAKSPLKLGTACSGTDAPALALTLVQEQMALRNLLSDNGGGTSKGGASNEEGNLLNVEHVFSCEVDAFKQAYLARNFDSILYPDIGKLCDDPPLDVYGRPKEIPPSNFFVAGTSCKNFSMLRTSKRIDIEQKGCSGETFLGAVEFLFKEKPKFVIFENVIGAPWEKMKEYITGRITLSNCSSSKAINNIKTAEKKMDLTFAFVDGKIVVDHVPGIYGVRCGSVVKGFVKGDSSKLREVAFPNSVKCKKNKKCTLTQLMEHNKISKKTDTLVFETGVTYCAHYMKVDTKEFGLPQTRLRTYMFVWQPDDDDVNDDLGEYWEAIVRHLQAPVRHSLEAFILEADHDIIRVFREALDGPAGRTSKREAFLEPDFWTSTSANLKYNTITRKESGIDQMARSLTNWGEFGRKQCPPHYWQEFLDMCKQRQMDVLEILHASAARDAESHDSSFSSFFWNISQNAGKEKHRGSKSEIAGCLTPGGNVFLPHQGRPLLGCEKLLIQGIPYFRLLLGTETEVQLGDLAGNAMSLTVVCATMLGAVTCKQLRRECLDAGGVSPKAMLENKASLPTAGLEERLRADIRLGMTRGINASTLPCISDVFKKLFPLAKEAVESSILCTCESSGRSSHSADFVQCRQCGVSCCRDCLHSTAGYQLEGHDAKSITVTSRDHGIFQSKLHEIVPTSVVFDEVGISALSQEHRAKDLDKFVFNLHRIRRDKKAWRIIYYARADAGTGEAIAEFVVTIGEVKERGADSTGVKRGVQGQLTSFLPAKLPPLVYGPMVPCAKLTVASDDGKFEWMQRTETRTTDLLVSGNGETPSFRAEAGINDDAANALEMFTKTRHKLKLVAAAKKRGELRRWLYPDNWKTWPETITISGGDTSASVVHGKYIRADCRQTTNQSALWIREKGSEPTLYLLLHPKVSRNGADYAVVSSSISHQDASSILATFPSNWQPCDALKSQLHEVKGVKLSSWSPLALKCNVPKSEITVSSPNESQDTLLEISGFSDLDITMLSRNDASRSSSTTLRLNVARGQKAQQTVRLFNSLCITPILQHAARGQLKYDISPDASWIDFVPPPNDPAVGSCDIIVPRKPAEIWEYDDEREEWVRHTEPGASRQYYTALQEAPQTFNMILNTNEKKLVIRCDPRIAAHRAARNLIDGRGLFNLGNDLSVKYRLSDTARQTDPVLDPFNVSNCESLDPTSIELNEPYELYARQKKAVTKMAQIEDGMTAFEELEMFEETMPGSSGWSLIAKATRTNKIRGGVIADAIGAGKTVISIALIVRGIQHARAARKGPSKSSATLVVVPPGLLDQWVGEIKKFAPALKSVRIYGLKCLKELSVKDLIEADVVICPVDILEDKGYFQHVLQKCGENQAVAPKLPTYAGQRERSEALGVWVPASSQDPYGGTKGSQNDRNKSAHYTFVYADSIQKLRKKSFKMSDKGVPLEYFEWERVIVDEIHESLCTSKGEMNQAKEAAEEDDAAGFFKEKNRRAGRELLGVTEKDITKRPLRFRAAMFGLTGTPLLDSCDRVIELANLMGGTYVIGLSSHWRKLERESMRDIFLQHYLEPRQSREVRRHIYSYCQKYLDTACCRNKTGAEMDGVALTTRTTAVSMNAEEKKLYLGSMSGIAKSERSLSIKPEDFDVTAGHDISRFLRQNAKLACRGKALVDTCKNILAQEGNERTKIIVFADGGIGAGAAARNFLCAEEGLGCTWLDSTDSVEAKNRKISFYQGADVTEEDRCRPRVLLLNFEHAAGLNLQTECNNLILFTPLYVGQGGVGGDAVADASTELQAIGRVYRPGQRKREVNVYRIEVRGPDDEECLDGQLIRRNTDEETVAMATNAAD